MIKNEAIILNIHFTCILYRVSFCDDGPAGERPGLGGPREEERDVLGLDHRRTEPYSLLCSNFPYFPLFVSWISYANPTFFHYENFIITKHFYILVSLLGSD